MNNIGKELKALRKKCGALNFSLMKKETLEKLIQSKLVNKAFLASELKISYSTLDAVSRKRRKLPDKHYHVIREYLKKLYKGEL